MSNENDYGDIWSDTPPTQPPAAPAAPAQQWAPPGQAEPAQPWAAPVQPAAAPAQPAQPAQPWAAPAQPAAAPAQPAQPAQPWAAPGQPAQPGEQVHEVSLSTEVVGAGAGGASTGGWHGSFRIIGLIVGVLAFGGLGFAAATGLFSSDTGAADPASAVDEMMDAMENEDIIAMMEVMAPGEVGRLSTMYPRFIALAQKEGALSGDDPLAGIDITVEGMVTETVSMHSDVAKVYMQEGTIRVTVNPDELDPALAPFWDDSMDTTTEIDIADLRREMDAAMDEASEFADEFAYYWGFDLGVQRTSGLYMMTVEQNGRWYISPYYTMAEYGREILGLPEADFSLSRENAMAGAGSAEGIFTGLEDMVNGDTLQGHLNAVLNQDADAFAELAVFLPPNEVGVFLDYGPSYMALFERLGSQVMAEENLDMDTIMNELRAELDNLGLEGQLTLDINTSTEDIGDGNIKVYLDSGSVQGEISLNDNGRREEASINLSWDKLCGTAEAIVSGELTVESDCVERSDIGVEPELEQFANEFDRVFVVVNEQNGSWYISYVETGLAYMDMLMDSIEAN